MNVPLEGHTALVTGAASGIGLATARAFAEERCSLRLWNCDPAVMRVAAELAAGVERRGTGATWRPRPPGSRPVPALE